MKMKVAGGVALFGLWLALGLGSAFGAEGSGVAVWSLGKADGAAMEFAPGARGELTFTVGQSVVSKDFAGHQDGSVAYDGKVKEKPYRIEFDLPEAPQGNYELVLDLIYSSGAPKQMKVSVNERMGIFPIRPSPRHSASGEEGNAMLLAGEHLVVPVPAAWLKEKGNQVTLVPLGLGGLSYDAICFERANAGAPVPALHLEPTIFYRKSGGKLMEVCQVSAPFAQRFERGMATVRFGKQSFSKTFTNTYDFGLLCEELEIPSSCLGDAQIELKLDAKTQQATESFKPAKQWKVFVCPKVHNDIGYTDLQPHVNELDNRNTDTVLEILEKYPFYKFNFETAWLVDNYLDCRTAPYRKEFFDLARQGRAGVNALYLNLMTGICTGEELYRAVYYTHRLHREQHSNFDFACITDAPSHSWFLPTLFSDVGVKGFSNGANQSRAPILHHSDLNEDSPFYWEGMNGEKIFMWYARSYVQLKRLTGPDWLGNVSSLEYLQRSVPQFLVRYMRDAYVPDAVMIYGEYVDNAAIPRTADAPAIERWNKEYEYPKLVVATDAEYFRYINEHYADRLPVYRGDCGAYWEDGVGSTMHATTQNRQTQALLPVAETAASLASIFEPRNRYPAEEFWQVWRKMMFYDEHTWGAHNSISQPGRQFVERQWEIKESYATHGNLDARNLLARANNRLCQQIAVDGSSILAFNWQNRSRSAVLEVEIGSKDQLVDLADQKPVPMDVYFERDGWRKVRFLAQDVPPLGYKAYGIRFLDPAAHKANEKVESDTIENEFYRLTVDTETGGLKSLFDKVEKRELLDTQAPYKLNQYLYVSGGEGSLLLNFTFGTPPANLVIDTPAKAEIVKVRKTPLGQRLEVVTKCKNTPAIRSEYLLYDHLKRVDIVNTVEKEATRAKEAVYFAFPFAAQHPGLEYQIQNGWVRPNADQMPGACREWFTPQNLVHVSDGDFSVAWATPDAPLVTLTDINRGKWLSHLPIKNGHVYSYAMNNYWFTNYRAEQGGSFVFHYVITSGRGLGREQLGAFDADTRTPVLAYPFLSSFSAAIAQTDRPMPPGGASFATLEAPNLQIVTLKEAETGDGWVLRLREVAGRTGQAELKFPRLRLKEAWLCNGVEENQRRLAVAANGVSIPYKPNQFTTLRLKLESDTARLARK
jgi:alpha-mannosidase